MEMTYHGTVTEDGVRLDHPINLPLGTEVKITVLPAPAGSPQELLAALDRLPPVSKEDVEALLGSISGR